MFAIHANALLVNGSGCHEARLLQRLEDKGYVERDRSLSVHLFSAAISRQAYAGGQLELLATSGRDFNIDAHPDASLSSKLGSAAWNHARVWLLPIWLLGSVVVFAWSLVRVCGFSRLLAAESEVAPQELQTVAARSANRLGLKAVPTIYMTSAHLSPMVWWIGGKVRIVIPTALLEKMDAQQSQWILAHVRRRDHLVRWIEWLACVCFWWNPVTWWARRNLRANEEICCDALVVSSLKPAPKSYAKSLLTAIESLACPALRPPAMASEINSGGFLERRFEMIVSNNPNRSSSRWLQICVLLCAMVVLPLGIASAQDYDAVERRLGEAVSNGELSLEQAGIMMGTLRKAGGAKKKVDIDAIGRKIRAAVAAGEITKEEGRAKMAAIRKRGGAKKDTDYEAIGKRIRAAVQAGKMTKEEGRARMAAIRKEGADRKEQKPDRAREYLMKVRKDLGAAIEGGKISEEDAKKRYKAAEKAVKERMAAGRGERRREGDKRRISREDFANAAGEIRKAISEGRITEEQGKAKLEELRKRMAGIGRGTRERDPEAVYNAAEKKIKAAIAAGKITEEQGKARLEGLKRRLAQEATNERARGERTRGDRR